VDLELPELSVVPEETGFRYVKSTDRIDRIIRPPTKRKALYGNLLSQVALKCIDTVFRGAQNGAVECLTLNGILDTTDPARGQQIRVCLLSVRITSDAFDALNLKQVQPGHCQSSDCSPRRGVAQGKGRRDAGSEHILGLTRLPAGITSQHL
jgi:restriction system protein